MRLTENEKNLNYVGWVTRLKKYNCYSEKLIIELGERLMNAPFKMNDDEGGCYDGALIDVVTRKLCMLGYNINELALGGSKNGRINNPFLAVNTNMLLRVLLLQHISKAEYFVPQPDEWRKNRGILYEFDKNIETQLKLGERSAFLCMKYGIPLTEEEFEAMLVIDKDDKPFNMYQSPLAYIVKTVNHMVSLELHREREYEKNL